MNTYDVESFISATTSTSSTSFSDGVEDMYTAVSYVPMVTIVHHRSDLDAAGVTSGSTSTGSPKTGTGSTSSEAIGAAASTSNAAYRLGPRASTWVGLGAVIGGSAVAMALGMAMIML
jgi:hypothetical protein